MWKIDVPYLQQLSRDRRGRVGGWNDVRFWKQANHAVFFLLSCITSCQFVSGWGCAPVTRLATCSANMQGLFVAVLLTSLWFLLKPVVLCCRCLINLTFLDLNYPNIKTFSLSHTNTHNSAGLSHAALISPSHTLWHCLTKWSPLSAVLLFKRGGERSQSLKESAEWKPLHVNQRSETPYKNN